MSAISPAIPLAHPLVREKSSAQPPKPQKLVWLLGRLRYLSEPDLPSTVKASETARRFYYDHLHQPCVSTDERPVIPDWRGSYGSRATARAFCRDKDDFIVAFPFGELPLGDEIFESPTFCRPLWRFHKERDREHADIYTADLREQLIGECACEMGMLRAEVEALRDFADG